MCIELKKEAKKKRENIEGYKNSCLPLNLSMVKENIRNAHL